MSRTDPFGLTTAVPRVADSDDDLLSSVFGFLTRRRSMFDGDWPTRTVNALRIKPDGEDARYARDLAVTRVCNFLVHLAQYLEEQKTTIAADGTYVFRVSFDSRVVYDARRVQMRHDAVIAFARNTKSAKPTCVFYDDATSTAFTCFTQVVKVVVDFVHARLADLRDAKVSIPRPGSTIASISAFLEAFATMPDRVSSLATTTSVFTKARVLEAVASFDTAPVKTTFVTLDPQSKRSFASCVLHDNDVKSASTAMSKGAEKGTPLIRKYKMTDDRPWFTTSPKRPKRRNFSALEVRRIREVAAVHTRRDACEILTRELGFEVKKRDIHNALTRYEWVSEEV